MEKLHILNGDATAYVFEQTGIKGDTLIWREVLAEGPVFEKDLWAHRAEWFSDTFGEKTEDYFHKVLGEASRLSNIQNFNEVVLWFEFDLVCQINLIYILSVLTATCDPAQPITLICPEKIDGVANFRGLGQLSSDQLKELFLSRTKLEKKDLVFAAEAWQLYVKNDYAQIEAFLKRDFGNLGLLKNALMAHLTRFPDPESKLNKIEKLLLAIIAEIGNNRSNIYEAFWNRAPIYGITDLQLGFELDKLKEKGLLQD
jgi:predicted ATP-binding protein involved in virulence